MNQGSVVIYDLDNCISDDAWRIPMIDWSGDNFTKYFNYHSLAGFDNVKNKSVIQMYEHLTAVIMTARPVVFRALTEEWLKRNNVAHDVLCMRNAMDHRSSVEVKRDMVDAVFEHLQIGPADIVVALDDRPEIIAMYKSLGITARVLKVHDVDAYKQGV